MRISRIRLSDWLHPKAHGVQHILTALITITDECIASASNATAPSPYGKAFSEKSEAIWCLVDPKANHRFSFPSKAHQK